MHREYTKTGKTKKAEPVKDPAFEKNRKPIL
jgi:hypothetical protein